MTTMLFDADIHSRLIDGDGVCQRPENRPTATRVSLWETARPNEFHSQSADRHRQAKIACLRCPLLRACEAMLSEMERLGEPSDGVVAGRFSDCVPHGFTGPRQQRCRTCGESMRSQAWAAKRPNSVERSHAGEGLCGECYPRFSRWRQ